MVYKKRIVLGFTHTRDTGRLPSHYGYQPRPFSMPKVTLSAENALVIPPELLNHLGIGPGDTVSVELDEGGAVVLRAARESRPSPVHALKETEGVATGQVHPKK